MASEITRSGNMAIVPPELFHGGKCSYQLQVLIIACCFVTLRFSWIPKAIVILQWVFTRTRLLLKKNNMQITVTDFFHFQETYFLLFNVDFLKAKSKYLLNLFKYIVCQNFVLSTWPLNFEFKQILIHFFHSYKITLTNTFQFNKWLNIVQYNQLVFNFSEHIRDFVLHFDF